VLPAAEEVGGAAATATAERVATTTGAAATAKRVTTTAPAAEQAMSATARITTRRIAGMATAAGIAPRASIMAPASFETREPAGAFTASAGRPATATTRTCRRNRRLYRCRSTGNRGAGWRRRGWRRFSAGQTRRRNQEKRGIHRKSSNRCELGGSLPHPFGAHPSNAGAPRLPCRLHLGVRVGVHDSFSEETPSAAHYRPSSEAPFSHCGNLLPRFRILPRLPDLR
jgi:hypothetical protein